MRRVLTWPLPPVLLTDTDGSVRMTSTSDMAPIARISSASITDTEVPIWRRGVAMRLEVTTTSSGGSSADAAGKRVYATLTEHDSASNQECFIYCFLNDEKS